jgi:hypothetical protein
MERIVNDHYIRGLPYKLKKVVSQGTPTIEDRLVELVERCRATEKLLKPSHLDRTNQEKGGLKEGGRQPSQLERPRVWK